MNKFLVALVVFLSFALIPAASASRESGPQTITLTGDNLLLLTGEVNGDSVGAIIKRARELDFKNQGKMRIDHSTPLYLYLNTPGGSIISGMELIEALKGMGRPVHTVTAFAASMGFQIAQGLNNRYVLKSGILMSHRAAGQFEGSFGGPPPSQMDSRYGLWLQITKELDEVAVARTNGKQTLESYQKAYSNELWATGQQSIAGGYADEIVMVKCGEGLEGTTEHTMEFLGMSIHFELDKCPINTSPVNAKVVAPPGVSQEYTKRVLDQFLTNYGQNANKPLPMVL